MIEEKYWDDAVVGESCVSPEYEVTEARVMAYADLTGDHTPVHTDEAYAKTDWSRFEQMPLFKAVNRMNAYNTYLLMEQQGGK